MSITLAQLRARLQVLYDVSGSAVLGTSDWNILVNDGIRALWAEVTAVNKDFRVSVDGPFVLTSTQTHTLPADFREVRAVRRDPGTQQQRYLNKLGPRLANNMLERSYRLQGSSLYIEPISMFTGTYDLLYQPTAPVLVNDGDLLDAELEQFQDYIVFFGVVEAFAREESPADQFEALLADARARVQRWAADQRSADADQVEDVRTSITWDRIPP